MRFIIGSSGQGKTHTAFCECIRESIEDKDKQFIIIVPEQYTMQTQKEIVTLHPYHATQNIDVLSFNRLAHKVFHEFGVVNPEIMDDVGKAFVIKKAALECRDELKSWKNQVSKSGFIDNLKSMISEFFQYGIKNEDIERAVSSDTKIRVSLKNKLSDLNLIIKSFKDFIKDKYITTEEILEVCCKYLDKSEFIKKSHIIIDGFTGFTPIQYKIIEIFLTNAKELTITVTAPSKLEAYSRQDEADLFLMGKRMVATVTDMAAKNGISNTGDIDLSEISPQNARLGKSEALSHLENHFLRYDKPKKISVYDKDKKGRVERIQIVKSKTFEEEISFITSQILKCVKEDNLKFRDIAVITGDMESYKEALTNRFSHCEIPYYIDDNITVENNPLVTFVKSALLVIIENFSYESIMMYIKSALVKRDEKLVWIMDTYMQECGINNKRKLKKTWEYLPRSLKGVDIEALNIFKDNIYNEFAGLEKAFRKKKLSAQVIVEELENLFADLRIEERLDEMILEFEEKEPSELRRVREYSDVYKQILELLWKMSDVLKDEALERREFLDLFEAGVTQIKVGIIPVNVDKVVVGDITRSRLSDIKVLFLAGANEGVLIKPKNSSGILNDREKEILKDIGLELSATIKEDILIQRFYLYLMCTKMSEKLIITYKSIDSAGKSLKRSDLLHLITDLYTDLKIRDSKEFHNIRSVYEAKEKLIELLGEIKTGDTSNLDLLFSIISYISKSDDLLDAASYVYIENSLGKEVATKLFGNEIRASATRLEQFIDCPYKHFLKYGLNLNEINQFSFESLDIGNLSHRVIELIFKTAIERELDIVKLDETSRESLVEECLKQALSEDTTGVFEDSFKNKNMVERIKSMIKRMFGVLIKQLEKGDFRPHYIERKFNSSEAKESLSYDIEDIKIRLSGKIDRVDIYEDEEKLFVKVIDYKTGNTEWKTDLTYYGKQLQLILYLSAIEEIIENEVKKKGKSKEVVPAALFYSHLADPFVEREIIANLSEKTAKELVDEAILMSLRPSGIVNSDLEIIRHLDKEIRETSDVIPVKLKDGSIASRGSSTASKKRIDILKKYVKEKVEEIASEIVNGTISVSPTKREGVTACDYCPYLSVCGFDRKTKGFDVRHLSKISNENVWELLENDEDDKENTDEE